MTIFILVVAVLIIIAGTIILINPEVIFRFLQQNMDKLALRIVAIVLRLILGVMLIYQSSVSKFPLVIEIIGWLSIVAALILALLGHHNFIRLMSWALSLIKPYGRVGGVLAAAFGTFLIYAFV